MIKIGDVFNRWKVISEGKPGKRKTYLCKCSCSDGTIKEVRADHLPSGRSKSCGCLQKEAVSKTFFKHGKAGSAEYKKEWANSNKEKVYLANKKYRASNKEKVYEWGRKRREEKPEIIRAYGENRRAKKINATPKWAEAEVKQKTLFLAKQAEELESKTGIKYEIDHIVPLNSTVVCGLHVVANLQLLTATDNMKKGNRYWPNM